MSASIKDGYLENVITQFESFKKLGDKTFVQLEAPMFYWTYNEDSNSIANLILHLSENMLSRFTDFLTTDGEKEWRNRDLEFEKTNREHSELIELWEKGWSCLFDTLRSLESDDLNKIVFIRSEAHTVYEAINRQLAHYPYHVGQIVFLGKMLTHKPWDSLSIPKGTSKQYNAEKFSKK